MKDFWNKKSVIRSDILVTPSLINLIGDVRGKKILDLGCGDGTIPSLLYKKGAKIIGVDKNASSIELAKQKGGEYICKDILKVNFEKESFDMIYSSMVFLFLSDKKIRTLTNRIYSWLKAGGIFILSDIHPATEIQKGNGNSFWVKHHVPKNFNYFKTRKVEANLRELEGKNILLNYFHRSLSRYLELIGLNRFKLVDLYEPQPTKKQIDKLKLVFESKNPSYIILKFIKDYDE